MTNIEQFNHDYVCMAINVYYVLIHMPILPYLVYLILFECLLEVKYDCKCIKYVPQKVAALFFELHNTNHS